MPEAFTETSDTKCEASTCPRGAVFVQWPMVTILNGTRMFHAMHSKYLMSVEQYCTYHHFCW